MAPSRMGVRAVLVSVGACIAYEVLLLVPVPGVDGDALAMLSRHHGGGLLGMFDVAWTPPAVSLGLVGVGPAVLGTIARSFIAPDPGVTTRAATWTSIGVQLALVVFVAWTQLLYLGSIDPSATGWMELVGRPFSAAWMLALMSMVTGGVLIGVLCDIVGRIGVAHGPLVLAAGALALGVVPGGLTTGMQVANESVPPSMLVVVLAAPVALAITSVAAGFGKRAYPLRVARGLAAETPFDLALAPVLALSIGPSFGAVVTTVPGLDGVAWTTQGAILLVAIAVAVVALAGRGGERHPLVALPGLVVFVAAALSVLIGFFAAHRARPPSPWQGDADLDVALASETGDAEADADRIAHRLDAIGVEAEVLGTSPHEIRLRLHGVSSASMMNDVATPQRLSFHLVALDQAPLHDATEPDAPTADEARALIATAALPPGTLARVECGATTHGDGTQEEPHCVPWILEPDAMLTSADVTDAEVRMDENMGAPVVMITFSHEGAARFADVTGANVQRKLAICVDDDIVSQPVIQSRIPGGTAMITMGASFDYEHARRSADALAAALTTGPLTARWTVASEAAAGR